MPKPAKPRKPLRGEFEGLLRLRVGNHRVLFDETANTIAVHRVRDQKRRTESDFADFFLRADAKRWLFATC
jgi:mRNA-degrading endonuclease RelE of RelBE toxin-antitoxin system